MTVLHADQIEDTHPYLATARPNWRRSLTSIRADGGPWPCTLCDGPSYLPYRCSKCGTDLVR